VKLISYKGFAKLRPTQFYPKATRFFAQETGFECSLGYAGFEGFAFTYFAWRQDKPGETGEISLDFRVEYNECPPEVAQNILRKLRLPLRPGMPEKGIMRTLGKPRDIHRCGGDVSSFTFLCTGSIRSQYEVTCDVDSELGLIGVRIVREDLRARER
jgi:hypothetical protein